jgi:hypothetical protein
VTSTAPARKGRWEGTTPEQRRAATAAATAARRRDALDRRITELADSAALLTEEQRARLAQLLNGQPAGGAA